MMKRSSLFLSSIAAMCVWTGNAYAVMLETNEWSNRTQEGWIYTDGKPLIDANAGSPSGGEALKFIYAPGVYSVSTGGGKSEFVNFSATDIYVGHWFKFSPGFVFNPFSTKIDYMWVAQPQTATGALGSFTIREQGQGSILAIDVTIQGNGQFVGIPHAVYTSGATRIVPGTWYWLEFHTRMNDVLTANPTVVEVVPNGVLEVWINDVLQGSWTNLRWRDKQNNTWAHFLHSPEWGGGGGTIPAEQYLWVDHTVMSTTRIGRPGATPRGDVTAPPSPTLRVN